MWDVPAEIYLQTFVGKYAGLLLAGEASLGAALCDGVCLFHYLLRHLSTNARALGMTYCFWRQEECVVLRKGVEEGEGNTMCCNGWD